MINWGTVPLGAVLPFPFATYGKTNGESITLTGLAVTDIEIYKGTSMTQRASDAGYTLLDTDGIDIDTITGIHGFSVDTGDNTDAGFFVAGSFYWVVVSAVTVDSQTVNFVAGTFSLRAAESVAGVIEADVTHWLGTAAATPTVAGVPEVDVTHWLGTAAATPTVAGVPEVDVTHFNGTAGTFASGRPEVNTSHIAGSAVSTTTAQIGVNVVQLSGDATAADNAESFFDGTGYAGTGNTIPTVTTVTGLTASNLDAAISTRATPAQILTTALTEAYAADGAAPTLSQALFQIMQFLHEASASGTTVTVKKIDGSTTAMTFTLNDGTTPTSITRAT